MNSTPGGVLRRAVATGASAAIAVAGLALAAAPAHAAPVTVTGTLTDAAGNGLDGYVYAYALQADGFYDYATQAAIADGQVALNVEPGTYKFDFSDEDQIFVDEYYNDKPTLDAADAVVVAGPTTLAPVSLAARFTLTGQVVSANGRPIENAEVQIFNATDDSTEGWARTRADGTWVAGVDAGTFKARFEANGYAFEYYNNKADLATADVVGAGTNLGQVVLSRGSAVQGVVTNPTGGPLERVRATVYTTTGTQVGSDLTDATGAYRVEGVAPGSHKVQFSDPVGEFLSEWNSDKPDQATADAFAVGVDAVRPGQRLPQPQPRRRDRPDHGRRVGTRRRLLRRAGHRSRRHRLRHAGRHRQAGGRRRRPHHPRRGATTSRTSPTPPRTRSRSRSPTRSSARRGSTCASTAGRATPRPTTVPVWSPSPRATST